MEDTNIVLVNQDSDTADQNNFNNETLANRKTTILYIILGVIIGVVLIGILIVILFVYRHKKSKVDLQK